jgi:hypothetical protein
MWELFDILGSVIDATNVYKRYGSMGCFIFAVVAMIIGCVAFGFILGS